ncbi:copper ion binding protein [Alkalihalobacillus sp. LMS39]|uniref:copper ion binding protein n=1 Tax=Alkalihalobacillus sp. LMS39 TaxID=2924032 RepID=UPI001FB38B06|nr:copper ion binding protein [Alkalihalobacillus sp. LMS39]UOE92744.1 copper ion binding protein [Alkalihalobacillus sp. LMS39]
MSKTIVKVEGMSCGHCVATVEGGLAKVTGVERALVNLENKEVTVEYDESKVKISDIEANIEELGYDVIK